MGHKEQVTQLSLFVLKNPYLKGRTQNILVSSSKDGFLKFWDLEQQCCVSSFSDELMTKVSDFVMIPELKAIVAGDDDSLKLYQIFINPKTYILDVKTHPKIKRECQGKVLEMHYNTSKKILSCLSQDNGNSVEFFKVNIDNQESILKKMVKVEKRKALKRAKNFGDAKQEDIDEDVPTEKKVDKDEIMEQI